jgi:hypothetical protein
MDKFGSVIDRMNMKLGSKIIISLRIKTQLLNRLQRVIVVDGTTHSQKDCVEGNGGYLKDGAEAFMLFLRGAQLVMWSSVLTVLDLDEMNVTLENAEIFGSALSGEGESVGGGWRCC